MRFNDETRTRLLVPVTLSEDPTGSTLEVKVDGTWYPCTWQDAPVGGGGQWKQTGRTTTFFAGPAHTAPAGAVVLSTGTHSTEVRVTLASGDTVVAESTRIDVR